MYSNPISVYLHIPFCTSKCTYCAFNTYINLERLIPAFVDALIREIQIVGRHSPYRVLGTIYFGGGTPSLLSVRQFEQIIDTLNQSFNIAQDAEITTELNPNDLTLSYLDGLRSVGINRLSIGMQSANTSELKFFARRHDSQVVKDAVNMARQAQFDNLSLDLMYGFPHQTIESWWQTLDFTLALHPEHISLYALGLEEGTPMHDWVYSGYVPEPDDDLAADMYDLATEHLGRAGFEQYEISNWAQPGRSCQHNLQYWRNMPYIGLGPGAHGYAGNVRYSTMLSPQQYIRALSDDGPQQFSFPLTPAVDDYVKVNQKDEISETLITGLRLLQEGIKYSKFSQRFGIDLMKLHGDILSGFQQQGLLHIDAKGVRLSQRGRLLSNVIFRNLV